MRGILKRIIYKGCLKDLCFYGLGLIVLLSPLIAKFIADYTIYKLGV